MIKLAWLAVIVIFTSGCEFFYPDYNLSGKPSVSYLRKIDKMHEDEKKRIIFVRAVRAAQNDGHSTMFHAIRPGFMA